jgi:hypothetical protein
MLVRRRVLEDRNGRREERKTAEKRNSNKSGKAKSKQPRNSEKQTTAEKRKAKNRGKAKSGQAATRGLFRFFAVKLFRGSCC